MRVVAALWARPGERLLPALSAVLLVLSFPPLHLLVPPFVALVPFAVHLSGLTADPEGRRAAFRSGFSLGLVYFGLLVYWILVALIWFSKLAILAYLASVLILAAIAGLVGWVLHGAIHRLGTPLWLALALVWTGGEWIQGHLPDLAFPWLGLGTSLTGYPELVGAAELVGSRGVTFWIASVNGLVAAGVLRWRRGSSGRALGPLAAAVMVVLVFMGWGLWRARTLELRPAARVAVVQPDIAEDVKLDAAVVMDSTGVALARVMSRLEPGSVDLVVWPEVTFPVLLEQWPGLQDGVREHARYARAPVLFGALGHSGDYPDDYVLHNAAFLVTPGSGLTEFTYRKRFLVPMVERVPWLDARWFDSVRYLGAFAPGDAWSVGRIGLGGAGQGPGLRFGVLICYESAFPRAARELRREGADILVNMTNDGWYGRDPWYARTTALWQHPAHLVMRAIENRVGVARAANTGISMFVDPLGRTSERTGLFTADVRSATVQTTDVRTLYSRTGDLAGLASAVLTLLMAGWLRWGRGLVASA